MKPSHCKSSLVTLMVCGLIMSSSSLCARPTHLRRKTYDIACSDNWIVVDEKSGERPRAMIGQRSSLTFALCKCSFGPSHTRQGVTPRLW